MTLFRALPSIRRLGQRFKHGEADSRLLWPYNLKLAFNVIAPCMVLYGVLFVDFGEREHVFMPVRRWVARQKTAFLTLSPAEREMLEANESKDTTSETSHVP